jgi:hypothetical protein
MMQTLVYGFAGLVCGGVLDCQVPLQGLERQELGIPLVKA